MKTRESNRKKQQIIPGYRILKKLGAGGMGAVYLAKQKSMDRLVALKVLPRKHADNRKFKERFFREARAAGRLNHPNIVAGIDASEAGGYCYLVMEYVEGESVAERIDRSGAISETESLAIGIQIAKALAHAWENNIVHRDVKPANFLLARDGTAKLCDLGVAKAPSDANLTQDGTALGTPNYIAPEQAKGAADVDFRADIYSLGASLYCMLSGRPPFEGPTAPAVMMKHLTEPLTPLRKRAPDVSKATAAVVEKMLAKKPGQRYRDAASLLADLEAAASDGRVSAGRISASGRRKRTAAHSPAPLAGLDPRIMLGGKIALACIALVICGVVVGSLLGSPDAEPTTRPATAKVGGKPDLNQGKASDQQAAGSEKSATRVNDTPQPSPKPAGSDRTGKKMIAELQKALSMESGDRLIDALNRARSMAAAAGPLVPDLSRIAYTAEAAEIRSQATAALAVIDREAGLAQACRQLAGDRNEKVRLAAIRLLEQSDTPGIIATLKQARDHDPSPPVARAAAAALKKMRNNNAQ